MMMEILKKTMWLALCSAVLLVAGCGDVSFNAEQLKQANELCKDNGGIKNLTKAGDWFYPNYICNDGVSFEIYGNRIEKHEPIIDN